MDINIQDTQNLHFQVALWGAQQEAWVCKVVCVCGGVVAFCPP